MNENEIEDGIVEIKSTSLEQKQSDTKGLNGGSGAYIHWFLLTGLVLFGFAMVASYVMSLKLWMMGESEPGLVFRLLVKGLIFSIVLSFCIYDSSVSWEG